MDNNRQLMRIGNMSSLQYLGMIWKLALCHWFRIAATSLEILLYYSRECGTFCPLKQSSQKTS